ncbi:hypothetical protein E8E12_002903 [Didymella heteroderae]|uniref:Uncharacterized protein n=1 Tax=Didymella heteroderae TaxID=1769908 RepID=A0A9P4WH77_9PLEO|nr:hypothetical protein E8E12_002903 [Didymella heteroderae]
MVMDWSRWRNPVQNFVNLGGLYGRTFNLRAPFKLNGVGRPGWAYFADGSVFFPRFPYTNEELQEVMKIAADFVRSPTDGKMTLQRKDDSNARMILLENLGQHPITRPPNLHVYGRYVQNGENLLIPSTRYSAITLELDSTRSTHASTQFAEQVFTTSVANSRHFLSVEQWVKSSSAFRGTLVDGVLQPGVRLGNGLSFTLSPSAAAATERAPGNKDQAEKCDASRSSIEAEWQREFPHLRFSDFVSAISVDPPLDSSLGLDLRRGFDPLLSIDGGLSLNELELDLRQREKELKRLMNHLLWEANSWRIPGLTSAANELESQVAKLQSRLESQRARQDAWGLCDDDALKRANLEERELILKAEVAQLKWMQTNWLWLNKVAKVERTLKRVAEAKQDLKKRENIYKRVLRKHGLEQELKRALERETNSAAPPTKIARGTDVPHEQANNSTRPSKRQAQPAPSEAETMSVFDFLNESNTGTPDALEMFQRANGKP